MSITEVVDMEVSKEERSVRSLPPTYALSLVFSHGYKYRDQTFCTLSNERCHVKSIPEMRGMWCVASSYGWLMMKGYYSPDFYLFNPDSLTKIHLPPLSNYHISGAVLTSSPTDPSCVVMLFDIRKKSIVFCRICSKKWVEQSLKPYNKDPISIDGEISAISCKGKIYLIFSEGMATIHEFYDKFAEIEPHDLKYRYYSPYARVVMSCSVKYLESCGEIFRVSGIMFGLAPDLIQTFDVFKLDFSTMSWVMVESIGDRIFLLSRKCSLSVSATEVGLKGNCIYFVLPRYTSLYRYDMHEGTIKVTLPCPKKFPFWDGPFWVVRNCELQLQVISKRENVKNGNDKGRQDRSWDDLLTELLPLIMSSLFLDDCIRFRLTCKSWNTITPPHRLNHLPMQSESGFQLPWLISFPKNNMGVCNFYHPIFGDAYSLNFPELAGAILYNARYGWLLMSRGICIFLFNPFSREIVNLPDLEKSSHFQSMFFSSPPTSSDFVVFGLHVTHMLVYRKGENTWRTYCLRSQPTFQICTFPCNPVFYGGIFYFLCTDGRLALFNPNAIEEESQWKVFPESAVFCMSLDTIFETSIRNFIVECDGEILSVFVGLLGKPISIFKLDHMKMKWERLENLGDKVLFLSGVSTLIQARAKGIENRIYFPRFHGQHNLFYSLSTCNYHSFGNKDSREDWLNTTEHWHCAWIHPTE